MFKGKWGLAKKLGLSPKNSGWPKQIGMTKYFLVWQNFLEDSKILFVGGQMFLRTAKNIRRWPNVWGGGRNGKTFWVAGGSKLRNIQA